MMDFGTYNRALRAQEGEWLHVLHPDLARPLYLQDGKPPSIDVTETDKPVRVLVQGVHSPELRKMHKAFEDQLALLSARMGRANGSGEVRSINKQMAELQEKHGLAMIGAAIKGWENFVYNGEVLPFSDEAKAQIMPQPGQLDCPTEWLTEQIAHFSRDRSNFFQKPATD